MPIELTTPVIEPAKAETVYSEMWLAELHVADRTGTSCRIIAVVVPCRTCEDGSKEFNWPAERNIVIENFWEVATQDELGVMFQLVAALKARGNL